MSESTGTNRLLYVILMIGERKYREETTVVGLPQLVFNTTLVLNFCRQAFNDALTALYDMQCLF